MQKEILNINDVNSLEDFLNQPTLVIAEVLTGLLAAQKKEWTLSVGNILQSFIKGNLLMQLGREIAKYRENGKIKEDYLASEKSRASLYELLRFLDEGVIDKDLFSAAKSIFITGIGKDSSELDEFWAYEFLKTAKKLSGTEILILKALFEIVQGKGNSEASALIAGQGLPYNRVGWRNMVSKQLGIDGSEYLVFKYEDNLEKLGLISPRNEDNRFSGDFIPTANKRLTDMGVSFCKFITNYND